MLIGESPGYYEDMQGVAFVGKSGQLLDKILSASGLTREEHAFIGNIIKCRPPNNKDPLPEDRDACIPYLYKQIALLTLKSLFCWEQRPLRVSLIRMQKLLRSE